MYNNGTGDKSCIISYPYILFMFIWKLRLVASCLFERPANCSLFPPSFLPSFLNRQTVNINISTALHHHSFHWRFLYSQFLTGREGRTSILSRCSGLIWLCFPPSPHRTFQIIQSVNPGLFGSTLLLPGCFSFSFSFPALFNHQKINRCPQSFSDGIEPIFLVCFNCNPALPLSVSVQQTSCTTCCALFPGW